MLRCILSAVFLCSLITATAIAQSDKRPMSVDDVVNMIGVSGPQISPDASSIVFSRSELDWDHNKRPTHLWIVRTSGGEPHQFTSVDGDSSPEWSPDSKSICFLRGKPDNGGPEPGGDREPEGRQIWIIKVDGGEANQLTSHKGGINSFHWSHDGKVIFFLANQTPTDAEKKKTKEGDDAIYVDEGPNGQSRGQWSHVWTLDLEAKKEKQITKEDFIISGFDPSPDGKWIAFTGRKEGARNGEYLSEIYIAEVSSGTVTRLTENQAPESSVKWSPDGHRLAYLAPDDKEWKLANAKIWIIDVGSKKYKNLSTGFEGSIGYCTWQADGILFSGQHGVARNIYRLNPETDEVKQLTNRPGAVLADSFSEDGRRAAAVYSTAQDPPDVWAIDTSSGEGTQLTDFNPAVKKLKLAKSEVITWKSTDGLPIEGVLYLPEDYKQGARIPLILTVHGGPAGSFTNAFSGIYDVYTGLGYAVLCPNVRGSSGYSDSLLDGNMHDLGGGDYHDLMTGVDAVIARGIADPNRLGIRGWSYGGILSGWTITQTNRFKAASLGAMVTDWASEYAMGFNFDISRWYIGGTPWDNPEAYRKESSYAHVKSVSTPSIIFHGERDITDTIGQSMMFYQALKDRGVPVRFIRFPREPHGFREPHHQRIRDAEEIAWMQKYVNGVEWKSERPGAKSNGHPEPGESEKPEPQHQ